MSFPRYPAYKDSGVEWLGEVPKHWQVKRIRHVAQLNPSKTEIKQLDPEMLISFLPMEAVGDAGGLNLEREITIAEAQSGYTYFREGDVTYAKITPCFENGKGAHMRGLLNGIGFGSTELVAVRPDYSQTTSDYLNWIFRSPVFRHLAEASMYGAGGQKRVPDNFTRDFSLGFPPIDEQVLICRFLSFETAKLDNLMTEQEKLIALLKEKRQAVIAHAVTKGLDPTALMKDSGVEWIGDAPSHWHIMPIRLAAKLESGHTPSRSRPEYWEDCHIPWMTLADVWQIRRGKADYINETKETISELGLASSSARLLPKGTVVLSRTASVGFSAIMGVDMATTQDFANWVCGDKLIPEFLLFVFRSMQDEFRRLMMGSTHSTIYMPDIQAFRFVLPSLKEQKQIIGHCCKFSDEFDELIDEAQRGIDLLKERRTALISAAVTGQIDVRGLIKEEQEQAA